jgi:hypothetical protein
MKNTQKFLCLLFNSEDRSSMFFGNFGELIPDYIALHRRKFFTITSFEPQTQILRYWNVSISFSKTIQYQIWNLSIGSRVVTSGQTNMAKLTGAFFELFIVTASNTTPAENTNRIKHSAYDRKKNLSFVEGYQRSPSLDRTLWTTFLCTVWVPYDNLGIWRRFINTLMSTRKRLDVGILLTTANR